MPPIGPTNPAGPPVPTNAAGAAARIRHVIPVLFTAAVQAFQLAADDAWDTDPELSTSLSAAAATLRRLETQLQMVLDVMTALGTLTGSYSSGSDVLKNLVALLVQAGWITDATTP